VSRLLKSPSAAFPEVLDVVMTTEESVQTGPGTYEELKKDVCRVTENVGII